MLEFVLRDGLGEFGVVVLLVLDAVEDRLRCRVGGLLLGLGEFVPARPAARCSRRSARRWRPCRPRSGRGCRRQDCRRGPRRRRVSRRRTDRRARTFDEAAADRVDGGVERVFPDADGLTEEPVVGRERGRHAAEFRDEVREAADQSRHDGREVG